MKDDFEVSINKEIRNYTESMFFGLSVRQCVFSLLAVAVAVGGYFLLKPLVGMEIAGWACIIGAFPFALLGFFQYNGMKCEQFLWAWFKSTFLTPKVLAVTNTNIYCRLFEALEKEKKKENRKKKRNNNKEEPSC